MPRVLLVSKPVAPPFHDGTKCLVRDIALHAERVSPIVMVTRDAPPLEQALPEAERAARRALPVELARIYSRPSRFSPALSENARVLGYLLLRARADVWHFVFAPNQLSSTLGRTLSRLRRARVLQTVASPPRRFTGIQGLLFGDIVVAQSRWTLEHIEQAFEREHVPLAERPKLALVPPSVLKLVRPSAARCAAVRSELGIGLEQPLFVYPGDLEVSRGAENVAAIIEPLVRELPGAIVVFAYREKSRATRTVAFELQRRLDPRHVRFTCTLPDVLELIASATAVLFPVDDLWGKVDLPIVLLESMALGVPVAVLDEGPLRELEGALRVEPGSAGALLEAARRLGSDPELRQSVVTTQLRTVEQRHSAHVVARAYEQLYLQLLGS